MSLLPISILGKDKTLQSSTLLSVLTAGGILCACAVGAAPISPVVSTQWGTFPWGSYTINNSVYNPPNGKYNPADAGNTQSIGKYLNGWRVQWKYSSPMQAPASFGSAYRGWHWGGYSPDKGGFPIEVKDNAMMPTSVAFSAAGPKYDVAYDMFFSANPKPGGSNPQGEVMVWLKYTGNPRPAGSLIAHGITLGNNAPGSYDVWYKGNMGKPSWPVISYIRRDQQVATSMDLQPFFWWAANRKNWIPQTDYILGIEFGIEPYEGSGSLGVTKYKASAY